MYPPVDGVNRDSQDSQFLVLGYGDRQTYHIAGDGICRWRAYNSGVGSNSDLTTRWYVMDYPSGLANPWEIKSQDPPRKQWTNVEFTGYVRPWKVLTDGAIRLAARSNHFNIHYCECDGSGYDFQISNGNSTQQSARAGKEVMHDEYTQWSQDPEAPTPNTTNNNQFFHSNLTSESNLGPFYKFSNNTYAEPTKWIGMKFVLRTMTAAGHVRQEGYIDRSNGRNGGNWVKVVDFIDNGIDGGIFKGTVKSDLEARWAMTGGCGEDFALNTSRFVSTPIINQYNPVLLRSAYACYFRAERLGSMDLKWFSCREVDPLP
jgi:hypothetical protein